MNENSLICKFIKDNPENWKELLETDYDLKIKIDNNYAIFNYDFNCNFANPVVQEARGIIIDYKNLEVVCWPFRKFGNHNESYCDTIDWDSARVLEKVDGSIIKLWFDFEKNDWQFSTNGTIRAENASVDKYYNLCFMDLINEADNLKDIPFETLDKNNTYIFELVGPQNQIIVKYPNPSLYHLGTRNNISGQEMELDIGIKKPNSYKLKSLDDCVNAVLNLNKNNSDEIKQEGFVVVDKNYHRIKVKSPEYLVMSRISQVTAISKKDCLFLLLNNTQKLEVFGKNNTDLLPSIKYYDYKFTELKDLSNKMVLFTRALYKEFDSNRGAVARVISSHWLSSIGFKAIENDKTGEELLLEMPFERLLKLIPDYEVENLSTLITKQTSN